MRYDLSDCEWSVIKPMLPNKQRGIPRLDDRRVLNAATHVVRESLLIFKGVLRVLSRGIRRHRGTVGEIDQSKSASRQWGLTGFPWKCTISAISWQSPKSSTLPAQPSTAG